MQHLTLGELAAATGCAAEVIKAWASCGLIDEKGGDFAHGDIFRIRLLQALIEAGTRLDDLVALVGQGLMSLDFAGQLMPDAVALAGEPAAKTLHRLDLPSDFVERLRMAAGQQPVMPDQPLRRDDVTILTHVATARALGIRDDTLVDVYRLLAHALRRTVDGMRDLFRAEIEQALLEKGASHQEMMREGAAMRSSLQTIGLDISQLLQRRFLEEAVFDNVVMRVQQLMQQAGLTVAGQGDQHTVAFCDLAGFTQSVHRRGDDWAIDQAVRLERLAQDCAARHDGRLIKSLGDGTLLLFADARQAARGCTTLLDSAGAVGLLPLRAGMATGQVVSRDGDIFGTTVNLAARIAAEAGPGELFVDGASWSVLVSGEDFVQRSSKMFALKGFPSPVRVHVIVQS